MPRKKKPPRQKRRPRKKRYDSAYNKAWFHDYYLRKKIKYYSEILEGMRKAAIDASPVTREGIEARAQIVHAKKARLEAALQRMQFEPLGHRYVEREES